MDNKTLNILMQIPRWDHWQSRWIALEIVQLFLLSYTVNKIGLYQYTKRLALLYCFKNNTKDSLIRMSYIELIYPDADAMTALIIISEVVDT